MDKQETKINLSDLTVCIPVKIDSEERANNLRNCVGYLRMFFDVPILVGESDETPKVQDVLSLGNGVEHYFEKADTSFFYRTRLLNRMYRQVRTPFVSNHDSDVFVPVKSWLRTIILLRRGSPFVYPYNGRFHNSAQTDVGKIIEACRTGVPFRNMAVWQNDKVVSFGGVVCADMSTYRLTGGENENFTGWGFEDWERRTRWENLEYPIARVSEEAAVLYHMQHPRGPDSCEHHPLYEKNEKELDKIKLMTTPQLWRYVQSWSWNKW